MVVPRSDGSNISRPATFHPVDGARRLNQLPDALLEAVELAAREALISAIPEEEVGPEEAAAIEEAWESYRREGSVPDHLVNWEEMDHAKAR